jgi:hypothetical protein
MLSVEKRPARPLFVDPGVSWPGMNLVAVNNKPGGVNPGALALLQCDDTQAAWLLDGTFDYARYCSIGSCP